MSQKESTSHFWSICTAATNSCSHKIKGINVCLQNHHWLCTPLPKLITSAPHGRLLHTKHKLKSRPGPLSSSTVVTPHLTLPKLLRGTWDRWVAQVSFITIYSTGLAPFPWLSAPPHSPQSHLQTFKLNIPSWWNDLPNSIRAAESLPIFKNQLKTHLFHLYLTLTLSILILFFKQNLTLTFLIFLYSICFLVLFYTINKNKKASNTSLLYSFSILSVFFFIFI